MWLNYITPDVVAALLQVVAGLLVLSAAIIGATVARRSRK